MNKTIQVIIERHLSIFESNNPFAFGTDPNRIIARMQERLYGRCRQSLFRGEVAKGSGIDIVN